MGNEFGLEEAAPLSVVLGALTRSANLEQRPLTDVLAGIVETAARTLGVARVNLWLFDPTRTFIECIDGYDSRSGQHSRGEVLRAADYPSYFRALEDLRAIAALDAKHDPRTVELREGYLARHQIATILDVPILRSGRVIGVICHEHVGEPRAFETMERAFAGSIGDLVALCFESEQRVELERERARLADRLARLQHLDSLGLMAGSVAHDFKNLAFAVLANAEILQRDLPRDSCLLEAASDIELAARRARELCERLLTCAGQAPPSPKVADLAEIVRDTLPLLRSRVPSGVSMDSELASNAPPVLGDPTQLRQVVLNLVINALDAVAEKRGCVRVRVRPDPGAGVDPFGTFDFRSGAVPCVSLEVADDGPGMDPETLRHAFEPFFTTKSDGHGFGLPTVLGVVRGHLGALQLDSTPGGGTRVVAWFPVAG